MHCVLPVACRGKTRFTSFCHSLAQLWVEHAAQDIMLHHTLLNDTLVAQACFLTALSLSPTAPHMQRRIVLEVTS